MSKARNATAKAGSVSRARRNRVLSQFDRYPLPFFDKAIRLTWAIKPTEDHTEDCATGRAFARQFLATCDGTNGWASLLTNIVADIVRMGPAKRWPDGGVSCGGIVNGFFGELGRALGTGELLIRAAAKGDIVTAKPPNSKQATKWEGTIADAHCFAVGVPLAQAIEHHRAMHEKMTALSDAMPLDKEDAAKQAEFDTANATERMALHAVQHAHIVNLTEAAKRAVYLEAYWRDYGDGDGEAEAAWPFLSPAIAELARFLP